MKEKIEIRVTKTYQVEIVKEHELNKEFKDTQELAEHLAEYNFTSISPLISEDAVILKDSYIEEVIIEEVIIE